MTTTQWSEPFTGPEMKVLCLPGDVEVQWVRSSDKHTARVAGCMFDGSLPDYALPADHPAVTVALHNRKHGTSFAYWPGGDEAPGDYDGGEILFRDGHPSTQSAQAYRWNHVSSNGDIIGYHKRIEQPAEVMEVPEWAKQRACELANEASGGLEHRWTPACVIPRWSGLYAFARYIAAHEDGPRDPLAEAFARLPPEWDEASFVASIRNTLDSLGLQITEKQP